MLLWSYSFACIFLNLVVKTPVCKFATGLIMTARRQKRTVISMMTFCGEISGGTRCCASRQTVSRIISELWGKIGMRWVGFKQKHLDSSLPQRPLLDISSLYGSGPGLELRTADWIRFLNHHEGCVVLCVFLFCKIWTSPNLLVVWSQLYFSVILVYTRWLPHMSHVYLACWSSTSKEVNTLCVGGAMLTWAAEREYDVSL